MCGPGTIIPDGITCVNCSAGSFMSELSHRNVSCSPCPTGAVSQGEPLASFTNFFVHILRADLCVLCLPQVSSARKGRVCVRTVLMGKPLLTTSTARNVSKARTQPAKTQAASHVVREPSHLIADRLSVRSVSQGRTNLNLQWTRVSPARQVTTNPTRDRSTAKLVSRGVSSQKEGAQTASSARLGLSLRNQGCMNVIPATLEPTRSTGERSNARGAQPEHTNPTAARRSASTVQREPTSRAMDRLPA